MFLFSFAIQIVISLFFKKITKLPLFPFLAQIVYSATDKAGNTGSATRVVNVIDTLPPSLTLAGPALLQWEANTTYVVSQVRRYGGMVACNVAYCIF